MNRQNIRVLSGLILCLYVFLAITGCNFKTTSNNGNTTHDNFKLVDSDFFCLEVPNNWELEPVEDSSFDWAIYEDSNYIGHIQMINYAVEDDFEEEDLQVIYIADDDILRKAVVLLYSDDIVANVIKTIRESFVFLDSPYNILDFQRDAKTYLSDGGQNLFGQIIGIDTQDNQSMAVQIKLLQFLADGPEDNNPNGFSIKDLKQIRTLSFDPGVRVAPLIEPNYNTYELYEMPLLDKSFLQNYPSYKYQFYDFILDRDGQLRMVLQHYIP